MKGTELHGTFTGTLNLLFKSSTWCVAGRGKTGMTGELQVASPASLQQKETQMKTRIMRKNEGNVVSIFDIDSACRNVAYFYNFCSESDLLPEDKLYYG